MIVLCFRLCWVAYLLYLVVMFVFSLLVLGIVFLVTLFDFLVGCLFLCLMSLVLGVVCVILVGLI